jgi:predicted CopG family antitoxin
MPPKGYITVYVRQDVFEQLMLLKARLRKRSINDVIAELLAVYRAVEEYEKRHSIKWDNAGSTH